MGAPPCSAVAVAALIGPGQSSIVTGCPGFGCPPPSPPKEPLLLPPPPSSPNEPLLPPAPLPEPAPLLPLLPGPPPFFELPQLAATRIAASEAANASRLMGPLQGRTIPGDPHGSRLPWCSFGRRLCGL